MFESGAGTTPATGNIVGHVRVLPNVRSPQLRNARDIQVYLPPSYKTSGRHYPVVYMHDGQNLFDPELSFAGEWGVDETMERLGPQGFESIVVAIPNMGGDRCHEYSPWVDARAGGGKGDAYLDFIVETLKPKIDRRFRTRHEREHTGIVGIFDGRADQPVRVSAHPGRVRLLRRDEPVAVVREPRHLRLCGGDPALVRPGLSRHRIGRRTAPRARHAGHVQTAPEEVPAPRDQIICIIEEGAQHTEQAWAQRFEMAVRFLLPKKKGDVNW